MNNAIHEKFTAGVTDPIITETFMPLEKLSVDKTLDERGSRYGSFMGHAEVTQELKFVFTKHLHQRNKSLDVDMLEALHMIFHKIGRIVNGDPNYADSWHDIAGYASLIDKRLNGEIK